MQDVKALLTSKKFWLTIIPMVSAIAMFVRHGITADQLSNALTAGFGILILAMAHEQNGTNQAGTNIAAGGDVTVSPAPKAPDSGNVSNLASGARAADQTDPAIAITVPEVTKGQP